MNAPGPASGSGPPVAWPASSATALALNSTGCFDWDLERGVLHMDRPGLDVFDLSGDEFTGDPSQLSARVPSAEASRLDGLVSQALKSGRTSYGAYFRVRRADGELRWAHTQGRVQRDASGRPYRIIGLVRDATDELSQPTERVTLDAERSLHTDVVERTTAALAHARTVDEVVEALSSARGLEQLGTVSMIVGLVEEGRIRLLGAGELRDRIPQTHSRLGDQTPLADTIATLTPRYLTRAEFARRYPRVWQDSERWDWSAVAFLPLIAQASAVGAIGLIYRDKHAFAREERTLLTALTSTIAQSLQRALLFQQEHELAEGLQRAMLPHSIPRVPGVLAEVRYRSARQGRDIGGDWYDVIRLPGGRVAAVVGDVQGHDTDAAAVMGQLRIVLRAYAAEGHSAPTIMARASTFLHDLDTDRFATCLYAEADPASGWVRLARAGHPVPLLRSSSGSCRPFPVLGALPLGLSAVFGPAEYPVTTMELEPGETLVMFTDGLIEQPGADLDQGMRELAEVVRRSPDAIDRLADRLCEVPERWGGTDDMALVVLHRESTVLPLPGRRLHQHVAPGDPQSLASVRHMVRAASRSWRAGDRADDVVTVTDALVTNALLHTDDGALVTVYPLGGPQRRVRVEVADRSSTPPRLRSPRETGASGRGLLLVDRLADVWGVESRGTGKSVWCEFVTGTHQ